MTPERRPSFSVNETMPVGYLVTHLNRAEFFLTLSVLIRLKAFVYTCAYACLCQSAFVTLYHVIGMISAVVALVFFFRWLCACVQVQFKAGNRKAKNNMFLYPWHMGLLQRSSTSPLKLCTLSTNSFSQIIINIIWFFKNIITDGLHH